MQALCLCNLKEAMAPDERAAANQWIKRDPDAEVAQINSK